MGNKDEKIFKTRRVPLDTDLIRDIGEETDIANRKRSEQKNTTDEIPDLISDGIKYRKEQRVKSLTKSSKRKNVSK